MPRYHNNSTKTLSKKECNLILKRFLEKRDGGLFCYRCKRLLSYLVSSNDETSITIEHVIPRVLGGSHQAENLKLCCKKCNNETSKLYNHLGFRKSQRWHVDYLNICDLC